jgi:CheY-like chemotaxis protein
MDVRMPDMDGIEACRIREWEKERGREERIPIIAFPADAMNDDRAACMAAGMDDFLEKPLKLAALREIMGRIPAGRSRPGPSGKSWTFREMEG